MIASIMSTCEGHWFNKVHNIYCTADSFEKVTILRSSLVAFCFTNFSCCVQNITLKGEHFFKLIFKKILIKYDFSNLIAGTTSIVFF